MFYGTPNSQHWFLFEELNGNGKIAAIISMRASEYEAECLDVEFFYIEWLKAGDLGQNCLFTQANMY